MHQLHGIESGMHFPADFEGKIATAIYDFNWSTLVYLRNEDRQGRQKHSQYLYLNIFPQLNWIIRYVEDLENRVEKMEKLLSMASIIPILSISMIMTDWPMDSLP